MASPNESSSSKRRLGRRRLPPLEPGPALQFVIANHPDQFRAGKTMRHVRSHVMYKHRIERKTSSHDKTHVDLRRSASACASSMSSPAMTSSDASASDIDYHVPPQSRPRSSTWAGIPPEYISCSFLPSTLRSLISQILSSAQGLCARSAPPVFEDASAFPFPDVPNVHIDSLAHLREQYIDNASFFCQDTGWMSIICADQMSFLSHVSMSSVYQDIADGVWEDSGRTMQAKTHVLSMIAGRLGTNDATILSILHLLLSEAGGDESAFWVHYQGLQGLLHRRGGLSQLPHQLATYITLNLTTLAVLKKLPEPTTQTPFPFPQSTPEPFPFISPFHAPHGAFAQLHSSCSTPTLEIITDMHTLTQAHLHCTDHCRPIRPTRHHQQIYHRLLRSAPPQDAAPQDWIHESIRLAALLYTHAILSHSPLARSAATPTTHASAPTPGATTLLAALLAAVERTDTSTCWEHLRGVFLWVCLVGGAASWGTSEAEGVHDVSAAQLAWTRKCFSLWAVRAVAGVGFEHAEDMLGMLRTGLRVRRALDGEAW